MLFKDKVVLVTGSSSGIGAVIAIRFAEEGAYVVLIGRNASKLKSVATKCEIHGNKPVVLVADLTEDDNVKNIVDTTIMEYGRIDILVNNVGMAGKMSIASENTMAVYDEIMQTNLKSAVYLTHLIIPYIIKTRGNIINIGSIGSTGIVYNEYFAYCTSKACLEIFTKAIALELAPKGVRVNIVSPGPVKTDFMERMGLDEESQKRLLSALAFSTALEKISEPNEVTDLVLFIASDRARSVTGSSFVIDNGCLLKGAIRTVD